MPIFNSGAGGGGGTTTNNYITAAPVANTVALLGTSITDANKPFQESAGVTSYPGNGYFYWANALLRQSMSYVLEAGVSGNNTFDLLARVGSVTAVAPGICVVETGPNDLLGGATVATTTNNLTQIYAALRAAGIMVVACHINPTTTILGDSSQFLKMHQVNAWISDYARTHPGIIVCPWSAPMSDPTTGGPLTGTLNDGTHPNTYGAAVMGQALATTLEPYIVDAPPSLPASNADPLNLLANGLLTGNSSGLATGWTKSGTNTATKVARADGDPGEWQQLVLGAGASTLESASITTGWATGDVLVGQVEIDGDFTNATQVQLWLYIIDAGYTASLGLADYYTSPKRIPMSRAVIATSPATVTATTTAVKLIVQLTGPGVTARVSRASVRKVV